MRFPATPGWVLLPVVVVGIPRHSWLRAPGAVPRHSWLGSVGGGGVWLPATPGCGSWLRSSPTPGWGPPAAAVAFSVGLGEGFPVMCVFVARRVRVVSVLVCVSCVRGGSVGVGVSCVYVGVCVCVCACVVCCGWFPRLGLAAGVGVLWVWLVCAVVGPSPLLAEVPDCDSPPLLAGFRCR